MSFVVAGLIPVRRQRGRRRRTMTSVSSTSEPRTSPSSIAQAAGIPRKTYASAARTASKPFAASRAVLRYRSTIARNDCDAVGRVCELVSANSTGLKKNGHQKSEGRRSRQFRGRAEETDDRCAKYLKTNGE